MELEKKRKFYVYEFLYKRISNVNMHPAFMTFALLLNIAIEIFVLYEDISQPQDKIDINKHNIFYTLAGFISFVVVLTLLSGCKKFLKYLWICSLYIIQAFTLLYARSTLTCFGQQGWCQQKIQYQIGSALLLCCLVFTMIIKNKAYFPFHDTNNMLSMRQENITIYLLIYRICSQVAKNQNIALYEDFKYRIAFTFAIALFWKSRNSGYLHPMTKKIWNGKLLFIFWTQLSLFIVYFLNEYDIVTLNDSEEAENKSLVFKFWQFWGYSLLFILLIPVFQKGALKQNSWKKMFQFHDHQISGKETFENTYLVFHQFSQLIQHIKKSQKKFKDPLFCELNDLINLHTQICQISDCPLSEFKFTNKRTKNNDEFIENKKFKLILELSVQYGRHVFKLFRYKHPKNLSLIVQLAKFELQSSNIKQEGIILYNDYIQQDHTPQGIKYSIFFLKTKIDDTFLKLKKIVNEVATQQISQFKQKIQISVTRLADFWYYLSEPKCNIKKLYDLANQLFPLKTGVQKDWQRIKLQKNIQSYQLYAKYLIKMFNDKQKGMQILKQIIKIQNENKMRTQIDFNDKNSQILEQQGIIFLQFDGKNPGVIFQSNINAQKIFGYNENELINRKVNDLMPSLYSEHHDGILQRYQKTGEQTMMNKERHIWGLGRDGYIFPMVILIKPVCNFYSQVSVSEVFASIKGQVYAKEMAGIIINKNQQITQVSSTAIKIFPELRKVNSKNKINICHVISEYKQMKQKILIGGQSYELKIQRKIKQCYKNDEDQILEETTYMVCMSQIRIKTAGQIGYIIKLTKSSQSKYTRISEQPQRCPTNQLEKQRTERFAICFSMEKLSEGVMGFDLMNNFSKKSSQKKFMSVSQKVKQNKMQSLTYIAGKFKSLQNTYQYKQRSIDYFKYFLRKNQQIANLERINYGQNIRTKRLTSNGIKQKHQQDEISFQKCQQANQSSNIQQYENIKPCQLASIMGKQQSNSYIRYLKLLTLGIILFTCICFVTQFSIINIKQHGLIEALQKLKIINEVMSGVVYLKSYTILFSNHQTQQKWHLFFKKDIQELDTYIHENTFVGNTTVAYQDESIDTYYVGFALNKLVSQANAIKQEAGLLSKQNPDAYFIMRNALNGIYIGLSKEQEHEAQQYNSSIQDSEKILLIFLICIFVVACIVIAIKNVLFVSAINKKSEILEIFFQIPRKSCSGIQKECEKFIMHLSTQNQEMETVSQGDDEGQITKDTNSRNKKKRSIIGQQKSSTLFLVISLIFLLYLPFYSVFIFLEGTIQKNELNQVLHSAVKCLQLQKSLSIHQSFMNSYLDDPQFPISQSYNHFKVITKYQDQVLQRLQEMKQNYYNMMNILDTNFYDQTVHLMYRDICQYSNMEQPCQKYLQIQSDGYISLVNSYGQILRRKYMFVSQFEKGTNTTSKQQMLSLQNLSEEYSYQEAIKRMLRKMSISIISATERYLGQKRNIKIYFLISNCILSIFIILVLWWKFYSNVQEKIRATEYILTFIPIDEVNRNGRISQYIREHYLQKK